MYNLVEYFVDRNVRAGRGDKHAYDDASAVLSYAQLRDRSCKIANYLTKSGVCREQRVAILMHDSIDWPVVFFGAIRAGIVPVALNTLLTGDQYRYMLEDSRAQVLFVSSALYNTVAPILEQLPQAPRVVAAGGRIDGLAYLPDILAENSTTFDVVATSADETAFWLYSSGSTGQPKGTRHVHSSMAYTYETYGRNVLGIREDDICFSAAKFFFAYGLGNSISFPLAAGASVAVFSGRPTPRDVIERLKSSRATLFFGVPTLYAAILADESLETETGLENLRLCVSAGEALPQEVGEAWKRKFGVDIIDGIGSTEMLHIFLSNTPDDICYGTSGREFDGYKLRLVDETGSDVGDGEIGELLVNGASAADGYWNQREKSRATFAGVWTHTGDKYTRDEKGYYHYCGRTDDMFKVSGIWVSPFEVESALVSHRLVQEAAVVGMEDENGLVKPKAFVVLKPGESGDGLYEELKEHVKKVSGKWKYPRWIDFVDDLPKTATGKIQRFKLRG